MRRGVIAIDGPAGSGKSSVSKTVATRLGFRYLDTGAFYRAFGLWIKARGIDLNELADAARFDELVDDFSFGVVTSPPESFALFLDDTDFTEAIRSGEAAVLAGRVAQYPPVRKFLTGIFQEIIEPDPQGTAGAGVGVGGDVGVDFPATGFVLEGRDTTTGVAPDAQLRVFLTADESVRLARRGGESKAGEQVPLSEQISQRDRGDRSRLVQAETAEGVHLIDTTDLSFDEVVDRVLELFAQAED